MLTILKQAWSSSRNINIMYGGALNLVKYSIPICSERSFLGKLAEIKVDDDNIVIYFKVKEPSVSPAKDPQVPP